MKTSEVDKHVDKISAILSAFPSRPAISSSILTGTHISNSLFSRSLLWKTSLLNIDVKSDWIDVHSLEQQRLKYKTLIDNVNVPWHLLSEDHEYYTPLNCLNGAEQNGDDSKMEIENDISNLNLGINTAKINRKQKLELTPVDGICDDPLTKNDTIECNDAVPNKASDKEESDLDVLLMIIGDVERLFPEHPHMFIQSKKDKLNIIEILFRYTKWIDNIRAAENKKKLGYVQGMHELCGVMYAVLKVELIEPEDVAENTADSSNDSDNDLGGDLGDDLGTKSNGSTKATNNQTNQQNSTVSSSNKDSRFINQIKYFLSSDYFTHDVFALFDQLMLPIIDKYFTSSGIVRESIIFDLKLHHLDLGSLKYPGLSTALKDAHIESQLWLTRWFRMLLTRELGLAYSIRIWDGLISYSCVGAMSNVSSTLNDISILLPYVILLLILRIRSFLLKSLVPDLHILMKKSHQGSNGDAFGDDMEALSLLLHYPVNHKSLSISKYSSPEPESSEIISHRKSNKDSDFYTRIPKLPSTVDLISDATYICSLSDAELNKIGPSLILKYARGDIYGALLDAEKKQKQLEKQSEKPQFLNTVFRKFTSSSSSNTTSSNTSSIFNNANETDKQNFLSSIDKNRTRLEMKLQKKVNDRLRDRS